MIFDRNFRYKSLHYNGHSVIRSIADQRIILDATFKDLKRWTNTSRSLFVESLLLGIPTQPIWCEETRSGQFVVVDGSERLRSIYDFAFGRLRLSGLKIKKEYIGSTIDTLPYHETMGIEDRYDFQFIIIDYDTHPALKCEFYRRLTSNDRKANPSQSSRNFAYRDALNLLRSLRARASEYIEFSFRGKPTAESTISESKIDEVFLRLLHLTSIADGHINAGSNVTIDDELDSLMSRIDGPWDNHLDLIQLPNPDRLISVLQEICNYYAKPISIELGIGGIGNENFHLNEFYHYFIRAAAGKTLGRRLYDTEWPKLVASARSLHNYIKRILND